MKKPFCDLCAAPAMEGIVNIEVRNPAPSVGVDTEVAARVQFSFMSHPAGFGGLPDLCEACRRMLIEEALDSVAPESPLPSARGKKR